jgi:superfamily II DNA/RNA helicase
MKFPKSILEALRKKDIKKPTPIQIQGLPVVYDISILFILVISNPK